jgi:hypothetical protein
MDWADILTWKGLGAVVGTLLGGGGVWTYLSARHRANTSTPSQIAHSQAALIKALNDQTVLLVSESTKDRQLLKRRIDHQGRELTRLSRSVAECQTHRDVCESELVDVRRQIAQLVKSNPPGGQHAKD